jgi:hypothetical protein
MNFDKKELLATLASSVEQHLDLAVSSFQNQPEPVLVQPSSTGGWSIAQCLDHLNSYADYYLPHLHKALQPTGNSSDIIFKSGWLGNYFANMMEPSEKKYKAFKGHVPKQDLDAYAVVAKFIDQQEDLLQLLQTAADRNLGGRIPITIFPLIRLKAGDVFRFLIAHDERHVQQALRNLA